MQNNPGLPSLITSESLPRQCETIIVGAGLTGLQLATELSVLGHQDIIILESGPALELQHINLGSATAEAETLWLDPTTDPSFWQPWKSESYPHFAGRSGLRRRVGGRSLYWQGITLPIEEWALVQPWWPSRLVQELTVSWNGGLSLYDQIHVDIERWRTLPIPYGVLAKQTQPFFSELGYQDMSVAPAMIRHHRLDNGEMRVSSYSPIEYWLLEDTYKPPRLSYNTTVLGILVGSKGANGVRVKGTESGSTYDLYASRIILAAGTVENTRLAIQATSGKQHAVDGSGLFDHIVQGLAIRLPSHSIPQHMHEMLQPGPVFYRPGGLDSRSNQFMAMSKDIVDGIVIDTWEMGEQLPTDENRIICRSKDYWPWDSVIHCQFSVEDKLIAENQKAKLTEFYQRLQGVIEKPLGKLTFTDFNNSEKSLPNAFSRLRAGQVDYFEPVSYACPLGTVDHEGGTLAYGISLTDNGELKAVPNLYVLGASSFPRMGAANPTFTNLALARRLAHIIG